MIIFLLPTFFMAEKKQLKVIAIKANIRQETNIKSKVLGIVSRGTVLEFKDQKGKWFEIILPSDIEGAGLTGYIHSSIVKIIKIKPEPEVAPAAKEPEQTKETPKLTKEEPLKPTKKELRKANKEAAKEARRKKAEEKKVEKEAKKKAAEEKKIQEAKEKEAKRLEQEEKKAQEEREKELAKKASPRRGIGFGLKFTGGMNYLMLSDVNNGNQGYNDYYYDQSTAAGWTVNAEVKPINFGIDIAADLIIPITENFGLGLGTGFIFGYNKSTTTYEKWVQSGTWTSEPKISAIPARITIFYSFPINNQLNVFVNGGASYYLTNYSWNWRQQAGEDWKELDQTVTAKDYGFHGGLGFEYYFSQNTAFVMEISGRYADISGFEGTFTEKESTGAKATEDGKLYYFEIDPLVAGKFYSIVQVDEEMPPETEVRNPRDATVDLTGLCIRVGIRIRIGR